MIRVSFFGWALSLSKDKSDYLIDVEPTYGRKETGLSQQLGELSNQAPSLRYSKPLRLKNSWTGEYPLGTCRDSVVCMIRSENMDDGTVKEYIYQRESDNHERLTKLKDENNQRITVLTHDEIVLMTPMWATTNELHYHPL